MAKTFNYNPTTKKLTASVKGTDTPSDKQKGTMGDLLKPGDLERAMPGRYGKKRPSWDHRSPSA